MTTPTAATATAVAPAGAGRARARRSPRRTARRIGKGAAVAALLVFTLFPAYFMLASAFAPRATSGIDVLLPTEFSLRHFEYVLTRAGFLTYLGNSVLVALITVVGSSLLALLAAVAVARFRFRLRTTVLILILVVQMVPLEALVISLFLLARDLQMLNSLIGLGVVYIALSLPFAVWMLRGFVAAVPVEVEEAAYIDGASWGRMFWSVLFPLVAPGLVATGIFSFITAWNEFILALTFMNDSDKYTVAVGLRQFFGQYTTDWGAVMAASTIITLPVMAFFLFVQRGLVSGLVAGAVKG
ncbi:carbohydrate ABC transporter permease [Marinitenerispora sediminis]|uniref:Sugar ABC transporter permease n=1 Tax=Marinitenerispora sediminis TaxID=1931232 RepID=A0A368T222_9ACTN|nr:carbohydrate ABC transporter permease [Marinitenerispora sediminis]RCV50178.1 sugar ABC transporter permease [Marinitenerispora sediminis]RCV54531.1 sugar ABC transporter permease [Marinitenerispora sediminis]RCV56954.1 sugar ABC transporter permease [Marinitenerispora sediminis]